MPIAVSLCLALCAVQEPPAPRPPAAQAGRAEQPTRGRGLVKRAAGATEGCTLLAPLRSTSTYLIDTDGKLVHEWKSDAPPGQSVYLLENGHLLRTERMPSAVFEGGGQGGRIREFDWDGNLVWEYVCADETRLAHHDVERLPNGHVLVIAWERHSGEEAVAAGRDIAKLPARELWSDMVLEVQPTPPSGGKVVWEWHAWDHLVQDRSAEKPAFGEIAKRPERIDVNADGRAQPQLSEAEQRELERLRELGYVTDGGPDGRPRGPGAPGGPAGRGADWLHTNSIAYSAELDLVLLGSRELSEIWVLDHSTTSAEAKGSGGGRYGRGGDLLFRWGHPALHGARGERTLFGQHDAHWIAADRLLVFNNGEVGARPFSSVDELRVDLSLASLAKGVPSVELAWRYTADGFFASHISGAQRLANGHTLICDGERGRVFEVDAANAVVWDYLNAFGGDAPSERRAPPGGGPGGRRGPPPRGRPGGRGPGAPLGPRGPDRMDDNGLFRVARYAPDFPGLARLGTPAAAGDAK